MADLSLDLNPSSPNYGDLLVLDGDLVMTSDVDPRGTNPILQDILQRVRFIYQEWFLDNTQGVPWFQRILIKNPDVSDIDTILMNAIAGTPGVLQLSSYAFTPNFAFRTFKVSFSAIGTSGPIDWSGNIGPTGLS